MPSFGRSLKLDISIVSEGLASNISDVYEYASLTNLSFSLLLLLPFLSLSLSPIQGDPHPVSGHVHVATHFIFTST